MEHRQQFDVEYYDGIDESSRSVIYRELFYASDLRAARLIASRRANRMIPPHVGHIDSYVISYLDGDGMFWESRFIRRWSGYVEDYHRNTGLHPMMKLR